VVDIPKQPDKLLTSGTWTSDENALFFFSFSYSKQISKFWHQIPGESLNYDFILWLLQVTENWTVLLNPRSEHSVVSRTFEIMSRWVLRWMRPWGRLPGASSLS
jgi:hypothetical protein